MCFQTMRNVVTGSFNRTFMELKFKIFSDTFISVSMF